MSSTLEDVLERLRQHQGDLRRLGVVKLGVFGSIVRDDARADSDLDVLVELDRRTFDRYMDLKLFLEDVFTVHVDLVLADRIKPGLEKRILAELIEVS